MRRYLALTIMFGLVVAAGAVRLEVATPAKAATVVVASSEAPAPPRRSPVAAIPPPREEASTPEEPDAETELAEIERLASLASDDAIAALRTMELPTSSLVRPSFLDALGTTAATASGDERARIVARLASFLRHEDLDGDRLYVYEALGASGDASAIDVLQRESSRRDLDEATVLVLVRELARLGAPPRSFRAVEQRLAESGPTTDDFDAEIRAELRRELAAQL